MTERTWIARELEFSGVQNSRPFSFHPADADIRSKFRYHSGFEQSSYLVCFIEPCFMLCSIGAEHLSSVAFKGSFKNPGPFAWEFTNAIEMECMAGASNGTIYAETMTAAMSVNMMRRYSNVDMLRHVPQSGGLSAYALRQVVDYMQGRMHKDISLADTATVYGLSLAHFARSFRASTGKAPHQWLIAERVERARDMLAKTSLSLSEIALAYGFAEQSHFTRVFRQSTNASPGASQRQRRA